MPTKLIILFLLIILIVLIFTLTNQEKMIIKSNFNPNSIGKNITEYLKSKESKLKDIKEGVHKRVIWSNKENEKTPLSIIYIHGFSASSEEIRPLPDLIAKRLKANLFYTRLKGHGRDAIAMSEASIKYWIDDLHEAIEIGSRIGDKVIVISSSTGGTLSSIASLDKSLSKNILSFIFISPNFGINHKLAKLLTWPLAKYWLKIFIGEMREIKPRNELNAKFWTLKYPNNALIPMANLVQRINKENFKNVNTPALFYYSLDDKVVKAENTIEFISKWGGKTKSINVTMTKSDDKYSHVIVGDIISPNQTKNAVNKILAWIQEIRK